MSSHDGGAVWDGLGCVALFWCVALEVCLEDLKPMTFPIYSFSSPPLPLSLYFVLMLPDVSSQHSAPTRLPAAMLPFH